MHHDSFRIEPKQIRINRPVSWCWIAGMGIFIGFSIVWSIVAQKSELGENPIQQVNRSRPDRTNYDKWYNDDPGILEASPFAPVITNNEHDKERARLNATLERISNLRKKGKLVGFSITSGGLPLNSADGGSAELFIKVHENPRLVVISCKKAGQGVVTTGDNSQSFTCLDNGEILVELVTNTSKTLMIRVIDGGCISSIKLVR